MTGHKLTKRWLSSLIGADDLSDSAKLTLLSAILNSEEDESVRISKRKLAQARGIEPDVVEEHMSSAEDSGWWASTERGTSRVIGMPKFHGERPAKKKRVLKFSTKKGFADVPVREWKAIHFAEFLCTLLEDADQPHPPKFKMAIGILKNGVQKLRGLDSSRSNPNVRYRQYLVWVVRNYAYRNRWVISDSKLMEEFVVRNRDA